MSDHLPRTSTPEKLVVMGQGRVGFQSPAEPWPVEGFKVHAPWDASWPTVIDPAPTVRSRPSTAMSVGRRVHIDKNVTVGDDTRIDGVLRPNPQARLSCSVEVGQQVLIGRTPPCCRTDGWVRT